MTSSLKTNSSLKVILLDDDPIFRLGLFTALQAEKYADIEVIAQAETAALADLFAQEIPDLLLLAIDLIHYPERLTSTVLLCQQLNNRYSNLIIFLLTNNDPNNTLNKIPGVKGYCSKGIAIEELIDGLRICAKGDSFFNLTNTSQKEERKLGGWLYNQCNFGLKQIENNIESISTHLNSDDLSVIDSMFWQGRKRELKAARWIVYQLLPSQYEKKIDIQKNNNLPPENNNSLIKKEPNTSSILVTSNISNSFDLTIAKIKASIKNKTGFMLEIDILQNDKKQELLLIIINQIKRILEELTIIDIDQKSLKEKTPNIIKDLWQTSTITFLSRYYTDNKTNNNQFSLINLILEDVTLIEQEILSKIPFISDLFCYWIFKEVIKIDNDIYDYDSEKGKNIEELLLQNLILNIANAIMQFILNNFSDNPEIRANLYQEEWKTSRKIAMFRNNLSWKTRRQKYIENPQNIFEDRYKLLKLDYQGIIKENITHPRNQELANLKGLPYLVTMTIEFRDSISKGVKSIGDIIGKVIVYILTEVIGKGIGLIGKGILQGIGKKIRN